MMKKALALGTIVIMVAMIFTMMVNVSAQDIQEPDWVAWYNNPYNRYDYAYDCETDANGNVFMVGYGYETSTSYTDIVTIKYDANGNILWKRAYNGPYSRSDYGAALTVDPQGNVYVCGRGYTSSSSQYDYMVIKYDANGNQMWARSYNGPASSSDYIYYYGQPIRYDNGRIFVTGYSYGLGTYYDIATICYDANSGAQYWVQRYHYYRYDYGRSLDVYNGNVYVAGYSSGTTTGYDYVTICYNQFTGAQLWVQRFNGYGSYSDYGYDVAVDDSTGTVFTTGYGYYMTTANSYDINTVAYNANTGSQLWVKSFHGGQSSDYGRGIESDDAGNVYAAGYSYWNQPLEPYTTHRTDIVVINYDSTTGTQKWVANYNGPRSGYSYEYTYCKPAVDPTSGNIAMCGYGYGVVDTYYDAILAVFSPTGSLVLEGRILPTLINEYQYSYNGATFGPDGSIFYAGYGYPSTTASYYDMFVAKFSSGIPATVEMNPQSLNLDSMGNWVSFKVESFPDNPEYSAQDVDPTSCVVAGINADLKFGTSNDNHFIGKADRLLVEDTIGAPGEEVEVEISGKLNDGTAFAGTALIKAILN